MSPISSGGAAISDWAATKLVQGIGFAKEGNAKEARTFLEWALRSDPSFDQRAKAWLWLSRISEDPKEKRNYLEEVLSRDLTNVEARRDLAILDGKLTLGEGDNAIAPAIAPTTGPAPADRYTCPTCGGAMAFDPLKDALSCPRCGYRQEGGIGDGSVDEHDFLVAALTPKGHSWEVQESRMLSCGACGATFTLPPARVSGACPFCGTAGTAAARPAADLIAPEAVLPFKLQLLRVRVQARTWLTKQRFRPGDLDEKASFHAPQAVYLPYWAFDITGSLAWRAEFRDRRDEDRGSQWFVESGAYPVAEYDVLVAATPTLPEELARELAEGFDLKELKPYAPEVLAGWPAEVYQVPLVEASVAAREVAFQRTKVRMEADVDRVKSTYGEMQNLSWSTAGMAAVAYKLLLLPVWSTEYVYEGKRFPVAVNGQTGVVCGQVPRSGVQRFLGGLFGVG